MSEAIPERYTDTELLDWLEAQNRTARSTGRCLFRVSRLGRGWRLHETSDVSASATVREAITKAILDEGSTSQGSSREDSSG